MEQERNMVGVEIASGDLAYLRGLAADSARPLDGVLAEAIGRYVSWRRSLDAAVEEGLLDVSNGRTLGDDELGDHLDEVRQRFIQRRG